MVKMDEHLAEIKETQRQISKTTSWKRKRDLKKYLDKLWGEYRTAKQYLKQER